MLADDLGFSDLGCYGSEIATPHLDRLAGSGIRLTNFHVNPMCSPTRASLLTGVNSHAAGVGVVAHYDPGFPGYSSELAEDVGTLAEMFRHNGYATFMVGKWHLTKEMDLSEGGSKRSWPTQRGFDRFYGILDAFTNYHHPHQLYSDNHPLQVDRYPDHYYLSDDLTDQAIAMIKALRAANARKPFFLYFAHGAVHAPLHAKVADIAKYAGIYDAGWDQLRHTRFQNQQRLGVVGAHTVLPPTNSEPGHDVMPWISYNEGERRLFARYMEIYAGMVDNVDQNFGRLTSALEEVGVVDNTLIIFTSDNGASPEGGERGSSSYLRTATGEAAGKRDDFADDLEKIELMGGPQTWPHYPRGWAMVSNTPFRLYKRNTHAGGHQVPFIVSWPGHDLDRGAFRSQYAHVTDLLPTLADLLGLQRPQTREGRQLRQLNGVSFVPTLRDQNAQSRHTEQYYENLGNRGQYQEGWEAVTLHRPRTAFRDDHWELYHLTIDPTEIEDLAATDPGYLAQLVAAWERAAWENQVFPLDEGTGLKKLLRPPSELALEDPLTIYPGTPTLEKYRAQALIRTRDFRIEVKLEYDRDDEGVLVAHGGQEGGYVLYIEDGSAVFAHNGYGKMSTIQSAVPVGLHEIVLDVTASRGYLWSVALIVDGRDSGMAHDLAMLVPLAPYEGIDIGIDRRSPVSWDLYSRRGPFPFTGRLLSVTYTPGPFAPDARARSLDELISEGARYE